MNIQFHEEPPYITVGSKFVRNNKGNREKWMAMKLAQYVAGMRGIKFAYKYLVKNT
jgi:hypothetical protein